MLQAIWLEPHFTVTNLTGIPLQIAQLRREPAAAAAAKRRKRDLLRVHGSAASQVRTAPASWTAGALHFVRMSSVCDSACQGARLDQLFRTP